MANIQKVHIQDSDSWKIEEKNVSIRKMLDISENFKLTNCRKVDHLADNFLIENQIIDRNTHTKVLSITW